MAGNVNNRKSFLGCGMKFPPEIDKATGRFLTSSGNETVKESLYLILMTQRTERFTRPEFGSDIMSYTFMDTGATMLSILRRNLTQTIIAQEPRISDIDIQMDYRDKQGCIIIDIGYRVISTNVRDNLVFPFYLNRGSMEEEPESEVMSEPVYYEDYTDADTDADADADEVEG